MIRFEVYGDPAPQGSKRAFAVKGKNGKYRGAMTEAAGGKHAVWRDAVAVAAQRAAEPLDAPLDGALGVSIEFRHRMPASRPARVRRLGKAYKTTAPDLDKLVRSTLDALTAAGLIADDARVCSLGAIKTEVIDGWTGADIAVWPIALEVLNPFDSQQGGSL